MKLETNEAIDVLRDKGVVAHSALDGGGEKFA